MPFTSWGSTEGLLALSGAHGLGLAGMHSAASMLLWCIHMCWSLVMETKLEMRRVPMEGHRNMLYPWIGTCLSV